MTIEYVDAGEAIQQSALSPIPGIAPAVTTNVDYERLLNARSESHNWLTYYGAYDGQRYSLLDQINT
jgi:alcohol dehydrogenase (cytochrome c)